MANVLLRVFGPPLILALFLLAHYAFTGGFYRRKAPNPQAEGPSAPNGLETLKQPRIGTRRWARALYFNGVITMEELNAFYADHIEEE